MADKPGFNFGVYNTLDSEWEYEYSEHETQDFYFTLDLTAHNPNALDDKKFNEIPLTDFQVLDLHTTNPIVKFGNDIYSCYWSTDLGTQIHVAPAGFVAGALRPGVTADIVATSRVRLFGRPATLVQRPEWSDEIHVEGHTAENAIVVDNENDSTQPGQSPTALADTPSGDGDLASTGKLVIPPELRRGEAQDRQASFLERLSAIKLRKGERDQVPVHINRSYVLPDNWTEVRQNAIDAGLSVIVDDETQPSRSKREDERTQASRRGGLKSIAHRGTGPTSGLENDRTNHEHIRGMDADENVNAGRTAKRIRFDIDEPQNNDDIDDDKTDQADDDENEEEAEEEGDEQEDIDEDDDLNEEGEEDE